jgi:threonine synthase
VPAAVGDFMILDAVRASQGRAIEVDESGLVQWMRTATRLEGLAICPETAATVGALARLAAEGWIAPDDRVVLFNTGAAQKYVEAIAAPLPRLDAQSPVDWDQFQALARQ